MIVLLLSLAEAQSLLDTQHKQPLDRGLLDYIGREMVLERLLPDDNLPDYVELQQVGLDATERHYVAVIRTYASVEKADQAWAFEAR
jgi:hypothetical protein